MKKSIILCMLLTMTVGHVVFAQSKAEQVKRIRTIYADAKKRMAENGKESPALDVKIEYDDTIQVSEDFIIDDFYQQQVFFGKVPTGDGYFKNVPYFISSNHEANGHTTYREFLYDPQKGRLLFSYMRSETHAGYVVETRYYYDADGRLVDQKYREGGKETTPGELSWGSWDAVLEIGNANLQQFELLMERADGHGMTKSTQAQPANKADRMKMIRDLYTMAKNAVAQQEKSDYPTGMSVIIHDRDGMDGPPRTEEYHLYFDKHQKDEGGFDNHCYFCSGHYQTMSFEDYEEFLFDPVTDDLAFYYDSSREENQHFEVRLYFDANGNCIESKYNLDIDNLDSYCDSLRAEAKKMLKVFRSVVN